MGLPALMLRPEAETVDRALANEISRDRSLMTLAASIAKTAIASLQAPPCLNVEMLCVFAALLATSNFEALLRQALCRPVC